jgi:hypothetical protein
MTTAIPTATGPFKPSIRLNETEIHELQLDSYQLQIHTHSCTHCECDERFSLLFEVWVHPYKTRTTGFKDLRRSYAPLQDLPLAVIEMPVRQVPICSDCIDTFERVGLPPVQPISEAAWAETLKRKYAPAPVAPVADKTASGRTIPSLDQL